MIEDEKKLEQKIWNRVKNGEKTTDVNVIMAQVLEAFIEESDKFKSVERDGAELDWELSDKIIEDHNGDEKKAEKEAERIVNETVEKIQKKMKDSIPNWAMK